MSSGQKWSAYRINIPFVWIYKCLNGRSAHYPRIIDTVQQTNTATNRLFSRYLPLTGGRNENRCQEKWRPFRVDVAYTDNITLGTVVIAKCKTPGSVSVCWLSDPAERRRRDLNAVIVMARGYARASVARQCIYSKIEYSLRMTDRFVLMKTDLRPRRPAMLNLVFIRPRENPSKDGIESTITLRR